MNKALSDKLAYAAAADQYAPTREDKFSFGLWTVGKRGREPAGDFVRPPLDPLYTVRKLAGLGAWGINVHDSDLVATGTSWIEREKIVREFKQTLTDHGMVVPMATTSLVFQPVFKEGAFTAVDPAVRAFALQKTMRAVDLAAELGAKTFLYWGGREGVDSDAAKDPTEALKRLRQAFNFLCRYVKEQSYDLQFALESKPNEPRGDSYLPTVGHVLAFIYGLDYPDMVGLNAEVAHENAATLNFYHGAAQALEAGKLLHIDLNDQKGPRFDQNLRFGSESLKNNFFVVKLLEEKGYNGPRHFDAHPYRTEDEEGVWNFATGCMRTYNMFKERSRRFAADLEIQALLAEVNADDRSYTSLLDGYSPERAGQLKETAFDLEKMAKRGYQYEKLDQLTIEIILGTR